MHSTRPQRYLTLCAAVALALNGLPVHAQTVDELKDLMGVKGASGESELERRGYTHIDTSKARDAAKVAIGAAALLGIYALAHKSHHRDDRNDNEEQTADFERGYRDGLYNNSFNSRGAGSEYRDGYNQGVSERGQQSNYRNRGNNDVYSAGWTGCAQEGEYCRVDGSARVRFGGDNRYEYWNVTGGIQCSTREFGDPAYGVNKSCDIQPRGGGYGNVNYGSGWDHCSNEGGFCSFSGSA